MRLPSAAPTPRSRSAAAPAADGRRRRRAVPRPRSACPRRPGPTARAPRPACPSAPAVALAPAHATSITRRPAARATLVLPVATPARAAGVKRLAAGGAARDTPPARAAQSRVFPRAPPRRAGLRGAALFFGRGRGVRRRHTSRALRSANLVNAARGGHRYAARHRARARSRRLLLIGHVSVGSSIELVTRRIFCAAL